MIFALNYKINALMNWDNYILEDKLIQNCQLFPDSIPIWIIEKK